MRPQEPFMPIVPELNPSEPVAASLSDAHCLEPPADYQAQPSHEKPVNHEMPREVEAPREEIAPRETDTRKEPDGASVSVSHEIKKPVIRIRVRPSGATSRAEGETRSVERSQGVVRHDLDRGATSSVSVDAPQRISGEVVSISNQNNLEEANSYHDRGSRMTASIGSVKFGGEGDNFGKELQCTADSGKASAVLPQDQNIDTGTQKYASLQTLSTGGEKGKKKRDKEKKETEKKRKREDPEYLEKKRLKKEKKQKEKEMAKLLSDTANLPTKTIHESGSKREADEIKLDVPSGAKVVKVETKAEPSSSEARPPSRFRIKLKSKALNNN